MIPVRFRRQECQTAAHHTNRYNYVKSYTWGGGYGSYDRYDLKTQGVSALLHIAYPYRQSASSAVLSCHFPEAYPLSYGGQLRM